MIFRNEAIEQEMQKPWAARQVSRYLSDLERWLEYGYKLSEEQVERLKQLAATNGRYVG